VPSHSPVSPFWVGGFDEVIRALDTAEEREIRKLEERIAREVAGPKRLELLQEIELVRERYAQERRRAHVQRGLTLFVGD